MIDKIWKIQCSNLCGDSFKVHEVTLRGPARLEQLLTDCTLNVSSLSESGGAKVTVTAQQPQPASLHMTLVPFRPAVSRRYTFRDVVGGKLGGTTGKRRRRGGGVYISVFFFFFFFFFVIMSLFVKDA